MKEREKIIQNYIDGYNQFNIEKMITDFDRCIYFENIQAGEVNMTINGLAAFKEQAEKAKSYFSSRHQRIISFKHSDNDTEVEIGYTAVLEMDFPDGLKKGQKIIFKGKSIFTFLKSKIIRLTDIS